MIGRAVLEFFKPRVNFVCKPADLAGANFHSAWEASGELVAANGAAATAR